MWKRELIRNKIYAVLMGAGIFAGCYFGEGWYGPSPFSFLRSSDFLRKRKLDHGRTRS